jgi:hypothetical protein
MEIEVKAYPTSQKSHDVGIYANVELQLKEGGRVLFSLRDATLRKSKDGNGWWISEPSRKVSTANGDKYYRYWWFSPGDPKDDSNRAARNDSERWIVGEVLKQIGDPNQSLEARGNKTTPATTTQARTPFSSGAASSPVPSAAKRPTNPFSPATSDEFALGGNV